MEETVMSVDYPIPIDQDELVGVCTEDVIMIRRDEAAGAARTAKLDGELAQAGFKVNASKNVDQELRSHFGSSQP